MIVVYTAIFGGYDTLKPVEALDGVRFVAFTDRPEHGKGWECISPFPTEKDARRENRKYKALPHCWFPSAECTIYLDGNLRLKVLPTQIADSCRGSSSLFLFRHNKRNCLYAEEKTVKQNAKKQVERYRREGYPENAGLFWGGLLVRKAGCEVFNKLWWSEIQNGSERDQISLPYCLWKTGVDYSVLDGGIPFYGDSNPFVERVRHKK